MPAADSPLAIATLDIADDVERWRAVGFDIAPDGRCRIGSVELAFSAASERRAGLVSWSLRHVPATVSSIDGLDTRPASGAETGGNPPSTHPIGARAIDHVVIWTPDVDRTVASFRDLGMEVLRTREGEAYGRPARQRFFELGDITLEVVGPPELPEDDAERTAPARFFGVAVVLDDIDGAFRRLGPERMGSPKRAVDSGRRITTLRSACGLRVPLAVMEP